VTVISQYTHCIRKRYNIYVHTSRALYVDIGVVCFILFTFSFRVFAVVFIFSFHMDIQIGIRSFLYANQIENIEILHFFIGKIGSNYVFMCLFIGLFLLQHRHEINSIDCFEIRRTLIFWELVYVGFSNFVDFT